MPLSSSYWSISLLPGMANFLEKSTSLLNLLVRPPYPSSTETLTSRLPMITTSYLSHFSTTNPSKTFNPEGRLSLGSLPTILTAASQTLLQVSHLPNLEIPDSLIAFSLSFLHAWVLSRFSPVWLLATPRTVAYRFLCPRDSPGKNTGVDCHFLLQGVFPSQGSKLHLLHLMHWRQIHTHTLDNLCTGFSYQHLKRHHCLSQRLVVSVFPSSAPLGCRGTWYFALSSWALSTQSFAQ